MLDPERLRHYMHTFFGYGSWSAPIWFVGMEEGGGENPAEISRRLNAWNGQSELVDLRQFHAQITSPWFGERARIQSTWGKLSALALCADGRACDRESIRRFQSEELGESNGSTALIELFPLPSPSTADWIYGSVGLPEIETRESYRKSLETLRVKTIQDRIDEHQPRAVVFYGLAYRHYWESIVGSTFQQDGEGAPETLRCGATLCMLAPHPVARGVRRETFCAIGRFIREAAANTSTQ